MSNRIKLSDGRKEKLKSKRLQNRGDQVCRRMGVNNDVKHPSINRGK